MKSNLYQTAKEYAEVIEKIEKTSDAKKLQLLEEKRIELHWKFIDQLKAQGIKLGIEIMRLALPSGLRTESYELS